MFGDNLDQIKQVAASVKKIIAIREDSQMYFSHMGGGGGGRGRGVTQECFSEFGNNRFFKWKNLVSKEEFCR